MLTVDLDLSYTRSPFSACTYFLNLNQVFGNFLRGEHLLQLVGGLFELLQLVHKLGLRLHKLVDELLKPLLCFVDLGLMLSESKLLLGSHVHPLRDHLEFTITIVTKSKLTLFAPDSAADTPYRPPSRRVVVAVAVGRCSRSRNSTNHFQLARTPARTVACSGRRASPGLAYHSVKASCLA